MLISGTIMAIDPSSTCTGYAVLAGLAPQDLLDAGRIVGSSGVSACAWVSPAARDWYGRVELAACVRVASMMRDLSDVLSEWRPETIVVEVPSGKIGTGAKRGARGSLTTYGLAAGAIWEWSRRAIPAGRVLAVTERMWTRSAGSKRRRQLMVRAIYANRYDRSRDPGGDVADAVGLGRWFLEVGHLAFLADG